MKDSDITEISRSGGNSYTMEDLCSGSEPTLDKENGLKERKHIRDKEELARFGKQQQLRVSDVNLCMIFSLIYFTNLLSRETLASYRPLD